MAGNVGTPAPTVFVGNLAYDLSEQDVIDYFGQVGPVKAVRIVTDRETGKPRGFGFVEYHDIATADSAIRNLSGSELNGRVIRIVFAEGGPGDFRPRREDERQEPRHPMTRNKVVGADLAYHSSQGMAVLLGQAADANVPADQLTMILSRKTRSELYEYLSQMQAMLRQNPEQARQTLVENPQLTRALFLMEIILGMVNNPLGDIAPKGIAHPGMLPPKFDGMSSMDQSNVQPGRLGANGIPRPAAPTGPLPYNPMHGAYPVDSTSAPLAASAVADPRLVSGGPPGDPRRQHYPISGPAPMAPTPRPMVAASFNTQQPTLSNLTQSTLPSIPGMTPEQQQALLHQVMNLTPDQVELLPPQQKAQVLALQQQLRVHGL